MNDLMTMFSYDFMLRATVAGLALAVAAGFIGLPLVLKRNAMIGDGLSHVGFAVFTIAVVLGVAPLQFAIPIVILTAFLMLKLQGHSKISADATIAIVSASALSVGILAVSLGVVNVDINSYLFGSILGVGWTEVLASIVIALIVGVFYLLCYHRIFALTFDTAFARSIGIKTQYFELVFAILSAVVIVLGMKIAGALLVSSLLVFPAVIAKYVARSFREMTLMSVIIAVIGFLIGLVVSFVLSIPAGASIVMTNLVMLIIFKLINLVSCSR